MEFKKGSLLDSIKVIDMGRILAGPMCASILADMGADVIKIESLDGDNSRDNLPKKNGVSTYYLNFNRSKRGVTLDLKSPEGQEIFTKLVKQADVIVENFRPGVMDKLGFGYEDCVKINPGIIFASISGFGQKGPYSQRAGFDNIAQAMGGIMSVTGEPGHNRVRCGTSIGDVMAAQNAALAIVAALWHRSRTGRGQAIDVALTDVCIIGMSSMNLVYLTDGVIPELLGNGYAASAPGDSFPTKDGEGQIVFNTASPANWATLCDVLGHPEWTKMPEFVDNESRVKNRRMLNDSISEVTRQMDTDVILNKLLAAGLAAGPVFNVKQVAEDEHFQEFREMFVEVEHPGIGKIKINNQSFKMSETTPYIRRSAPELGQHNTEVLKELGYTEKEIAELAKKKVI